MKMKVYFEKMSSSILEVGLASVSIFQLMSTEERSAILTCRMDWGHGSENWKGGGGTTMFPTGAVLAEVAVAADRWVAASLCFSASSAGLCLRSVAWNTSFSFSAVTLVSCNLCKYFYVYTTAAADLGLRHPVRVGAVVAALTQVYPLCGLHTSRQPGMDILKGERQMLILNASK